MKVELVGLNVEVEINEAEIKEYRTQDVYYEESAVTTDGKLVAFDEAINGWIQIG